MGMGDDVVDKESHGLSEFNVSDSHKIEQLRRLSPTDALREMIWLRCGGSIGHIEKVFDARKGGVVGLLEFDAGLQKLLIPVGEVTGCRDTAELFRFLDKSCRGVVPLSEFTRPLSRSAGGRKRPSGVTLGKSASERAMASLAINNGVHPISQGSSQQRRPSATSLGKVTPRSKENVSEDGYFGMMLSPAVSDAESQEELAAVRASHSEVLELLRTSEKSLHGLQRQADELRVQHRRLVSRHASETTRTRSGHQTRLDETMLQHRRDIEMTKTATRVTYEEEQRAVKFIRRFSESLRRLDDARFAADADQQILFAEIQELPALQGEQHLELWENHDLLTEHENAEISLATEEEMYCERLCALELELAEMQGTSDKRSAMYARSNLERKCEEQRLVEEKFQLQLGFEEERSAKEEAIAKFEQTLKKLQTELEIQTAKEAAVSMKQWDCYEKIHAAAEADWSELERLGDDFATREQALREDIARDQTESERLIEEIRAQTDVEKRSVRQAHQDLQRRAMEMKEEAISESRQLKMELTETLRALDEPKTANFMMEKAAAEQALEKQTMEGRLKKLKQEKDQLIQKTRRLSKEIEAELDRRVVALRTADDCISTVGPEHIAEAEVAQASLEHWASTLNEVAQDLIRSREKYVGDLDRHTNHEQEEGGLSQSIEYEYQAQIRDLQHAQAAAIQAQSSAQEEGLSSNEQHLETLMQIASDRTSLIKENLAALRGIQRTCAEQTRLARCWDQDYAQKMKKAMNASMELRQVSDSQQARMKEEHDECQGAEKASSKLSEVLDVLRHRLNEEAIELYRASIKT